MRCSPFGCGERLQRCAQQSLEIRCASFAFGFTHGGFRSPRFIAEIHQRRDNIGLNASGRGCCRFLGLQHHSFELVFQLDHHALRGLAADSRNLREAGQIAAANGRDQFFDAHAGENFESQRGPHTGGGEEHLE